LEGELQLVHALFRPAQRDKVVRAVRDIQGGRESFGFLAALVRLGQRHQERPREANEGGEVLSRRAATRERFDTANG
jgi:hypothetical protein